MPVFGMIDGLLTWLLITAEGWVRWRRGSVCVFRIRSLYLSFFFPETMSTSSNTCAWFAWRKNKTPSVLLVCFRFLALWRMDGWRMTGKVSVVYTHVFVELAWNVPLWEKEKGVEIFCFRVWIGIGEWTLFEFVLCWNHFSKERQNKRYVREYNGWRMWLSKSLLRIQSRVRPLYQDPSLGPYVFQVGNLDSICELHRTEVCALLRPWAFGHLRLM